MIGIAATRLDPVGLEPSSVVPRLCLFAGEDFKMKYAFFTGFYVFPMKMLRVVLYNPHNLPFYFVNFITMIMSIYLCPGLSFISGTNIIASDRCNQQRRNRSSL